MLKYRNGKDPFDEIADFVILHEGFEENKSGKDLVTGARWIGSGVEVPKYLELFDKTGKWTAADNRKAVKEILSGYTPQLKKTFGPVWDKLSSNQKLVLYDVAYNIGVGNLTEKSPKFVKAVLSGDNETAMKEMNWGNHQSRGLRNRNSSRQARWGGVPFKLDPIKFTKTGDGNKVMTVDPEYWELQAILKPVLTELPVQQSVITTPTKKVVPRIEDVAPAPWDLNQQSLNRGIDVKPYKSPFSLNLSLPSLDSLLLINSPLRLMELYFADVLGISDMLPLAPSLFPKLKDGKVPNDPYERFKYSLPDNQKNTPESEYNTRRYWELNGRPKSFQEAVEREMYDLQADGWHANSVSYNLNTGEYEFMKPRNHPTVHKELEWYNSDDAKEFRKKYKHVQPKNSNFDKYVPRLKNGKLPRFADGNTPDAQLEIVVTPKKRSKGSLSPRSAIVTPDITTEFNDGITRDQILDTIYISNVNGLNTYNKEQFFNKYGISADEDSEKYYKWLGGKPFLRSKTRREILSDKYKLHISNRYGQYAQDVADAINYINGYYKSPQYLDRIAGNAMDPVDYVAEARNFLALYEPSGGPAWQHSNDHENTFYIPMTSALFDTAYPDKEYDPYLVAAHEYAHYMLAKTRGVGDNAFNDRDKNLFNRRINIKYPNHDTNYNENYADLMATRADMYRRGYVDKNNPYGEITLDAIKDYRSKYGLNNRFFDLYNDEDIRSMYNTIAQNQYTQDDPILYARDGKLPGYSNGKSGKKILPRLADGRKPVLYTSKDGTMYNIDPNIVGSKLIEVTSPDVVVTGRDLSKPYRSTYAFNPTNVETAIQDAIKQRAYKSITPIGYNLPKVTREFINGERDDNYHAYAPMREALWAHYLGLPLFEYQGGTGNTADWIVESPYQPTKGVATYGKTYRFNPEKFSYYPKEGFWESYLSDSKISKYFRERARQGKDNVQFTDGNSDLGPYTMGSGRDENGFYVSYYDDWDINIGEGDSAPEWAKKLRAMFPKGDILEEHLKTHPISMYDRRYLTEDEWRRLGGYKDGKSPIHIKPANRGKFTRLKKRTGKSASWFKAHGTPAQKKMATFALNARKWKH